MKNKKKVAVISVVAAIVVILVAFVFIKPKEDDNIDENNGIIIDANDNGKDDNSNSSYNEDSTEVEQTTREDIVESVDSIDGTWATFGGDLFYFLPEESEAYISIVENNEVIEGTYETDNKTYIKVNDKEYEILKLDLISKDICLMLKDKSTSTEYYLYPYEEEYVTETITYEEVTIEDFTEPITTDEGEIQSGVEQSTSEQYIVDEGDLYIPEENTDAGIEIESAVIEIVE